MSKTYADALRYFRTKLKAGPEPVVTNLTTEGVISSQTDGLLRERIAEPVPEHIEREDVSPDIIGITDDEGHHRGPLAPHVGDSPEDVRRVSTTVSDPEFITLPDGTKRRIKPQQPTGEVYQWSHLMDYGVFKMKTPWRQQQLILQWIENEAQGGKHITLRGRPNPTGVCFGSCPIGNCSCHDIDGYTKGTL